MVVSPAVSTLLENPQEEFLDVSKLLITYADNILRHPDDEKYRSIRLSNPTFSTKLLPIRGAVECLFEMGFEEAETHLVFPRSASVEQLRLIRESIAAERSQRVHGGTGRPLRQPNPHTNPSSGQPNPQTNPSCGQGPLVMPPAPSSSGQGPLVMPPALSPPNTPALENSMNFYVSIQSNFQHVMVYEEAELQQKARDVIPHQRLSAKAKERLQHALQADPECRLGEADFLVLELLSWFKQDFFSWVDTLPCPQCGRETQNSGALTPNTEDHRWGAQRVEKHYCHTCQVGTRFPRYNNPEKLLQTRRGRCGEWANCFTLCCRSLGLEARYIWDSTDHVWTEVYSVSQRRWLHCDSCENVCDKPLLYEVGWGKKLGYILAFSKDQVVDVTWRYSCNHTDVMLRRIKVQEAWLRHTVNGLSVMRQQALAPSRRAELTERLMVELVQFISPKTPTAGDLSGRSSGSLAWRLARGETGAPTGPPVSEVVFTPTPVEQSQKLFHLRYSCAQDRYVRLSNHQEALEGWQSGVWRQEGLFRKVETDWQMVYLCRTEGSSSGLVSWKMDFSSVKMRVSRVEVRASSETFHSGAVSWSLRGAGKDITEFTADGRSHTFPSLSGSPELLIEARLSGGEGQSSWQHAQLFRQSLKETAETAEPAFEVLVHLEDA